MSEDEYPIPESYLTGLDVTNTGVVRKIRGDIPAAVFCSHSRFLVLR